MKSKKIFVLITALALSLGACNLGGNSVAPSSKAGGDSTPSAQPGGDSSDTPSPSSGGGEQTIAVTSITLNKTALALEEGKDETLKATVAPENASNTKVSWSSSNEQVAKVSSLGKVTAVKVGTATITVASVSNPDVKATCEVTVSEEGGKYGSLNKPKTVAEALAIATEECKETNNITADQVFVKGIVSKVPNYKTGFAQNIYLKDSLTGDKEFLVYSANHDALKVPYQNDEIIVKGYIKNYNGTLEMASATPTGATAQVYPEIQAVTRGTSTISYSVEHATVNADAPKNAKNLSEFTFTVTPDANYQVNSVSINGETVEAQADGSYKGVVKGNTAVLIDVGQAGVEVLNAVMKYTAPEGATASENMTGGNDAALVNLDPAIFSVVGGNETGIYAGLNLANNIRLYNNRNSETDKTDGTSITVSSVRAKILKIVITFASSSAADALLQVKAGDQVVQGTDGVYEINAGSFKLKNVTDGPDSKQIHINQIAISYSMNQEVAATAIALDHNTLELEAGKTANLVATLTPANATDVVVWSSDTEAVATVDQTGKVTAVAEGMAVIVAKVSDAIMARCQVTVKPAKVINYGTAEAPLNVAEAKAVLDETGSALSKQPLFVKGIVSESSYSTKYKNYTVWLQSDDGANAKEFELYATVLDASITGDFTAANALKGFEVVATGYGKIYTPTYELTNASIDGKQVYPTILSMKAPSATGIALDKSELSLTIGGEATLVATLSPAGATGQVSWSSSAEAVATVDQTGKVTAVSAGTAVISAAIGNGVVASCTVTVSAAAIKATSIELSATSGELHPGDKVTLTASVLPADTTDKVTWSTSDQAVATVEDGVVTAVAIGTATITATAGDVQANYALTVSRDPRWSTEFSITAVSSIVLPEDGKETADAYTVIAKISAITNTTYGNGDAVTEDGTAFAIYGMYNLNGKVRYDKMAEDEKPVAGDIVVLSGKFLLYKGAPEIKNARLLQRNGVVCALPALESIALNKQEETLNVGDTLNLVVSGTPADAEVGEVTWTSSDEAVASVANGVVTAVAAGTATITATVGELTATCAITVSGAAATTTTIGLTAENVLGYSGTNIAYPSDSTPVTATVSGMGVAAVGCAAYGDGIQMRTKNGITSAVYNTTEVDINKIEFVWAASKTVTAGKDYHLIVEFSNSADFSTLVGSKTNVQVNETTKLAEIAPTAAAKYFRVSHGNQGAVYLDKINVVVNSSSDPVSNPLPLAAGKDTKVEGAGFWVYLDNTDLGITGANAADIIATANITITLEEGNTPESAQAAVTGFLGSAAKTQAETLGDVLQFDSYEGNTVRLFFTAQAGVDASWQMKHTVAIELTIGGVTYSSTLVFIGGVLQA